MAEQRNSLKLILGLLLLSGFNYQAFSNDMTATVKIDNIFSSCIVIKGLDLKNVNGQLLLDTSWDVKSSTGECGCKSAAFSYRVSTTKQNRIISQGIGSTLDKNSFVFLINPDTSVKYNSDYVLDVDCSN